MKFFFGSGAARKADLMRQIEALEAERDDLTDRNTDLVNDLAQFKHQRKLEEDELKHTIRMREEALNMEHEKKVLQCERERDAAIAEVKDEYRDKLEARLQVEVTNMKDMYREILQRLPKVSVRQIDGKTEHTERTGQAD